jgi:hypothetical protein
MGTTLFRFYCEVPTNSDTQWLTFLNAEPQIPRWGIPYGFLLEKSKRVWVQPPDGAVYYYNPSEMNPTGAPIDMKEFFTVKMRCLDFDSVLQTYVT